MLEFNVYVTLAADSSARLGGSHHHGGQLCGTALRPSAVTALPSGHPAQRQYSRWSSWAKLVPGWGAASLGVQRELVQQKRYPPRRLLQRVHPFSVQLRSGSCAGLE